MSHPYDTAKLIQQMKSSVMFTAARAEKVMVRGKGSYLWDSEGRQYLDFIQGWAVNCLGHCPPAITRALTRQMKELHNASPSFYNAPWIELASLLTQQSGLDKVFFANTGAEANEGALKMARKYGQLKKNGAYEVITTWNSFHGRTLAMMSATGKEAWGPLFEPKVPGFPHVPFNDLLAVEQAITPNTVAVMVEPVQGEGGVFPATSRYLRGLRELCDNHGLLLILDEVQTGIGRCGSLFAFQQYGIMPDIVTLGKGLGGGFPVSAVVAKDEVCLFEVGEQGGTFNGQPLAMAAALAVVNEVIGKNLSRRAKLRGNYLVRRLKELRQEFGFTNIRGKGLLVAVDLPQDKGQAVVKGCLEKGLLLNSPRPATLRFMPALTVSRAEIDEMIGILSGVLKSVL